MAEHILTAIKDTIAAVAVALWARIGDLAQSLERFGTADSRLVVYICIGVVGLMLLGRILKLSFAILQKVVLPAALVAWAAGTYFNFPFLTIFPALVGVGSAWMLFKT